ncbi:MAG: hypothetical protein F4X82_01580 [Candidatus Spechtbacteria bacterium SB0662_bin_43]|uniref:Uncharacterized protein n=1 Tax=Candidatus Spechtbacteria bacterium SB0662_bin_43 TaxID=2604897 RepID=A0A845D9M5_9BACT|nr:hypothetical protein [Candidatus Spechtbacteria bacterium SB0662_bin_43]
MTHSDTTNVSYRNIEIGIGSTIAIIIAILALFLTVIIWLRGDIRDTRNELKDEMRAVESRLTERINGIENRMDRIEAKIDALGS